MQSRSRSFVFLASVLSTLAAAACSSKSNQGSNGAEGGSTAGSGGSATTGQGGATAQGGASTGNGGASTGNGGGSTGGAAGSGSGGTNAAGSGTGGAGTAGAGNNSGGMSNASGGGNATGGTTAAGGAGTAGSGGGATGGCTKGADTIFCEDFEGLPAGTAAKANGWNPVTSMGTLTLDAMHARGKQALHVHTDGNGHAYIQLSPFAPPQNSFFGRMYIWVTAFPSAPNYAHFTLVEASGTPAGVIRPIGGQFISGKGDLWGTGSDSGPTGDWTNWKESAPAEAGKWLCMEWEMTAADNNINVWIDSAAKSDLSVSTKMHGGTNVDFVFPTFNSVWFGWWLYQSGPTPNQYDVWIDDISLGTKRQGC